MDFIEISKIIFDNKGKYNTITDKDKENAFYMINKKLSLGKIKDTELYKVSQFLNNKYIDRVSALDVWFIYLKGMNKTPGFWFAKNPFIKDVKEKKCPKADRDMLMEYENLTEKEFEFLYEHYKDDVEYKIKLLKRLE